MRAARRRPWPGNLRELKHEIESAVILAHGEGLNVITERHLFPERSEREPESLDDATHALHRHLLLDTLEETTWNAHETMRRLRLSRSRFYR